MRSRAFKPRGHAIVLVTGAVLTLCALLPASAAAHAAFQDASPEPGARLARAPAQITLVFTEPLNRALTTARIVDARSGGRVATTVSVSGSRQLLLRPRRLLPTGAFRIEWHTVSVLDGHALEGSFGFGVRTNALGGAQQLEQSPLARDGWLRVALRGGFYIALFFFGGGMLCGLMLPSPQGPAGWLLAGQRHGPFLVESRPEAALRRIWGRTLMAGWIAVAAGIGVALAETKDAGGSLSWHSLDAYLLSTGSGGARALAVLAVLGAVLLVSRAPRPAAVALGAAFAAIAFGGHANSASPRALALLSDWLHLVAAAAWVGGIAQIAVTWLPAIRRLGPDERRTLMRAVLKRFGRVALPAAGVVAAAGVVNALIELGRPAELWMTSYGRVLLVKIALVATIATASYAHAFRLRPRLIAAASESSVAERRHWRLLGGEPLVAVLVVTAAALLAVFPLPPRQLLERAEAGAPAPAAPAALRPPRPGELSSAEEAGPWIAAAWVDPAPGALSATVRLLDDNFHPVPAAIAVPGARTTTCGTGCATVRLKPGLPVLQVVARQGGKTHTALIPIAWDPRGTATAERILGSAVATLDRLRSQRIAERLSSGLGGGVAISNYRVDGRHRYAIRSVNGGPSETVAIGRRTWIREPEGWQEQGGPVADAHDLLPWWTHRSGVRLLALHRGPGRTGSADVALADIPPAGSRISIPFWFRLHIDLRTMRVEAMRMITGGHFMRQRYYAFNRPVHIVPPITAGR